MRRIFILTALLMVAAAGSGCAQFSRYTRDRGNDLADCFTLRAGLCYGAGVRAQVTNYISAALGGSIDEYKVGNFGRSTIETRGAWFGPPLPSAACFCVLLYGYGVGLSSSTSCQEVSSPKDAEGLLCFFGALSSLLTVITDVRFYENKALPGAFNLLGFNVMEAGLVDDTVSDRVTPEVPYLREKFFIEVGATAGALGFDAGFNPVELVDFLLGWFAIDITGDDGEKPNTNLDKKTTEELVSLLADENATTRIPAVQELGRRCEIAAVEALMKLLKDYLSEVRCQAAQALGCIGNSRAVKALVEVAENDTNELVRCYAIEALGDTGDRQAIRPLIEQLKYTKGHVHFYASEALINATNQDFGTDYEKWKAWYEKNKDK